MTTEPSRFAVNTHQLTVRRCVACRRITVAATGEPAPRCARCPPPQLNSPCHRGWHFDGDVNRCSCGSAEAHVPLPPTPLRDRLAAMKNNNKTESKMTEQRTPGAWRATPGWNAGTADIVSEAYGGLVRVATLNNSADAMLCAAAPDLLDTGLAFHAEMAAFLEVLGPDHPASKAASKFIAACCKAKRRLPTEAELEAEMRG